jgi:hypothetical protein
VQASENKQLPPANGKCPFPKDMTHMTPSLLVFGSDQKEHIGMRRAKTHFEQIPVAVVKKIAEEGFPEVKEIRNDNVLLKVPAKRTEPHARGEHSRCRNGV